MVFSATSTILLHGQASSINKWSGNLLEDGQPCVLAPTRLSMEVYVDGTLVNSLKFESCVAGFVARLSLSSS